MPSIKQVEHETHRKGMFQQHSVVAGNEQGLYPGCQHQTPRQPKIHVQGIGQAKAKVVGVGSTPLVWQPSLPQKGQGKASPQSKPPKDQTELNEQRVELMVVVTASIMLHGVEAVSAGKDAAKWHQIDAQQ